MVPRSNSTRHAGPTARDAHSLGGEALSPLRVPVELGRGSVNRIEVLGGLAEGDEIILSDTSARDTWDAIRLR